jgi:hypothetical protein
MKKQNNNPKHLISLWVRNIITSEQYFFRLKANELNINTYTK